MGGAEWVRNDLRPACQNADKQESRTNQESCAERNQDGEAVQHEVLLRTKSAQAFTGVCVNTESILGHDIPLSGSGLLLHVLQHGPLTQSPARFCSSCHEPNLQHG